MSIFKIIFLGRNKKENTSQGNITVSPKDKEQNSMGYIKTQASEGTAVKKIDQNIKKRYKKAIATKDIAKFHQEALALVLDHLNQGEFAEYKDFMREIEYFLHYLFLMLQDDFFLGDKLFVARMTKLDDYIFSQYRRKIDLEENIQKITTLSYSNRFTKAPRENLLSYFVFIEESGIELINLLEDFYNMLQKTQDNNSWFSMGKEKRLHKTYLKKEANISMEDLNADGMASCRTFYTVQPSFIENTRDAQFKINRDVLAPLKSNHNIKSLKPE